MGFFSDDMAPMLGIYEAETSELIGNFESAIARIEQDGAFSAEDVADLFRYAHTIKGSSAMMGLDGLAELTHRVEDLFDILRNDPTAAQGRFARILDGLYSFGDFVKDELGRMSDEGYAPADTGELSASIAAEVAVISGAGSSEPVEAADAPDDGTVADEGAVDAGEIAVSSGEVVLKVSFKPDVPMVNARALVVLKQLGSKVSVLSCVPADLADPEAARTITENGLLVTVPTGDAEEARSLLAKNSFIRRIAALEAPAVSKPTVEKGKRQAKAPAPTADKFVSLRWSVVHDLQDLVGEFLLGTARLKLACEDVPEGTDVRAAASGVSRLVDELVYRVNGMAMVSVSTLVPQLSRMVRDMCRQSGKRVSFEVHGGDIEIDRNLYNSISDPLVHIVRNAVDHGIELPEERLAAGKEERGTVELTIESLGGRVAFKVSDDGRGIDTQAVLAKAEAKGMLDKPASQYTREEALKLTMKPGFSTSQEVTQYSGRGVGMDVVATVVRDFDGRIEIESETGKGSSIALFMPVSVTSVDSLGFRVGSVLCHLPLYNLDKIYAAEEVLDGIARYEGFSMLTLGKRQVPILDMHDVLDCGGRNDFYVVCHSLDDEFAISVDAVINEFSCSNKPLPSCLDTAWQLSCGIRNGAVMEDASVGYALNAALLSLLVAKLGDEAPSSVSPDSGSSEAGELSARGLSSVPQQLFAFELGNDRYAIPVNCVERIMEMPNLSPVPRAPEHLAGLASYRGRIVPAFDLARSAGAGERGSYLLIVRDAKGESRGLAITGAVGVRDAADAVLIEDQPEPRRLAGGVQTTPLIQLGLKEPPVLFVDF